MMCEPEFMRAPSYREMEEAKKTKELRRQKQKHTESCNKARRKRKKNG